MQRFWPRVAPYWHIGSGVIALIIGAILWVNDVSGYGGRIDTIEAKQITQEKRLIRIDDNIQMIGNAVGVKRLKHEDDE